MRTIIRDNYTPELGDYHDMYVFDEAQGKSWRFDCDGVFYETTIQNEYGDSTTTAASQYLVTHVADGIDEKIAEEAAIREAADDALQEEIDAIKNSPDVVDIVATYADLQAYDTSSLGTDDIVRVLRDEMHDGASTYYRWNDPNAGWNFIGTVGDYYTISQVDNLLAGKQDTLTAGENITIENNVISATGGQSDWAENDSTDPAYIKNRTHYTQIVETTTEQYGSTSAGSTPDSGYVWFIEKVEEYALSDILTAEAGDLVYVTITYSVNGVERTDGAKFTASIEDDNLSLDSDAEAGNRWRGAYVSELDGDTTFRWPVAAADSSATVYITAVDYEIVKQLDAKYIPVDGETIIVDANGKLASSGSGGPTVVQTTGTSTTDVMSQNATTSMIYADPGTNYKIQLGNGAVGSGSGSIAVGYISSATQNSAIALGSSAAATGSRSIAIGVTAKARGAGAININSSSGFAGGYGEIRIGNGPGDTTHAGAVAIGEGSMASANGEFNIGDMRTTGVAYGYNNSRYRLLTGLYDPQSAHDAATKGYVDTAVASAGGAEEINSTDWSALWQQMTIHYMG